MNKTTVALLINANSFYAVIHRAFDDLQSSAVVNGKVNGVTACVSPWAFLARLNRMIRASIA